MNRKTLGVLFFSEVLFVGRPRPSLLGIRWSDRRDGLGTEERCDAGRIAG